MPQRTQRAVVLWLAIMCGMLVAMIGIGGVTRLTQSGLSIVEWDPLMGAIPPLNEAQWLETFRKYQTSPQFKLVNSTMDLDGFKQIFFWEYFHRLWGRLIGVAYFVPLAWFMWRGGLGRTLSRRLWIGFALGGLQGALGWFMVMSGLVDEPRVSHLRLAAHLTLALLILGYLWWVILELRERTGHAPVARPRSLRAAIVALDVLYVLQVVYGAFTAGLRAGVGYNTFPTMYGEWVPSTFFALPGGWINVVDNPAAVQFLHRTLGWTLAFAVLGAWLWSRRLQPGPAVTRPLALLAALVVVQFGLGVATLLLIVPVWLATLHQVTAAIVLLALVKANHVVFAAPAVESADEPQPDGAVHAGRA